jgi:hypothetical protein
MSQAIFVTPLDMPLLVPRDLVLAPEFTPNEKTLYMILLTYARQNATIYPAMETLANYLGVGLPACRQAQKGLVDKGLLTITRTNRGKRYNLNKYRGAIK